MSNKIKVKVGSSENTTIVMFRSTERDKYSREDFNNPELLDKIFNDVKKDFITKCIKLLETCASMPSSLYTYSFFNKMFSIDQEGDVTASKDGEVYSFLISGVEDIDQIVSEIYVGYFHRNSKDHKSAHRYPFVIQELVDDLNDKRDLIQKMFGAGEFPFLEVRYAWHEGRKEWHYVYNITR